MGALHLQQRKHTYYEKKALERKRERENRRKLTRVCKEARVV
jgi:ribosomal protein S21